MPAPGVQDFRLITPLQFMSYRQIQMWFIARSYPSLVILGASLPTAVRSHRNQPSFSGRTSCTIDVRDITTGLSESPLCAISGLVHPIGKQLDRVEAYRERLPGSLLRSPQHSPGYVRFGSLATCRYTAGGRGMSASPQKHTDRRVSLDSRLNAFNFPPHMPQACYRSLCALPKWEEGAH